MYVKRSLWKFKMRPKSPEVMFNSPHFWIALLAALRADVAF